jgi:acetoin utilization deacetylase AcuC-like enzyme
MPPHLVQLDPDTVMSAGSAEAALRAAGAGVHAVDCVMDGWARAAFAAVRPPGHHAEPARAMGFCLFNNAAVAAMHARAHWSLARVAVVDFDVHHGNGTQAFFEKDPGLFYGSTHQFPCYPGTGLPNEHGVAHNIVNIGLPAGTASMGFRDAWADGIIPALRQFAPQLLIISAGFDAHKADPLAELRLEVSDFVWVTRELMKVADETAGGRIVSMMEGGYDLAALAACASAHVAALMHA